MKVAQAWLPPFFLSIQALVALAGAESANPLQKVLQLISGLQAKIIKEGEASQKVYSEYSEWCEDRSRELHFEIKTAKAEVEQLNAVIAETSAQALALNAKIEELAADIGEDEAALKSATALRKKEAATFAGTEKELMDTLDALKRAGGIIERGTGGGASLAQFQGTPQFMEILGTMVEANSIGSADAQRLTALVQSSAAAGDGDGLTDAEQALEAPAAAAYKSQSSGVMDALEGLSEKAEEQLDSARKAENEDSHDYNMKRQSLEDQLRFAKKNMAAAKKELAIASEKKAGAEGSLTSTTSDLAEDIKVLGELHHDCMEKATSFEEEVKSRGDELKAIADAKKAIQETTGGAEKKTYGLAQEDEGEEGESFLQTKSGDGDPALHAVHIVRRLAISSRSTALAQLATHLEAVLRMRASGGSSAGEDPFLKVKGLIADMISRLEEEADAEATKKAYCDKEMKETFAKKDDKEDEMQSLTTKIEQMHSMSVKLKAEVATLSKELGALMKNQAEADRLRQAEKAEYEATKPELEQGLEGVKLALKILREYYAQGDDAHDKSEGSSSGIIGLLEVVESDFSKQLAEVVAEEERASAEYEVLCKETEVAQAAKEADMKYKTKEAASLDKGAAETGSDLSDVKEEYEAVMVYLSNIKKECVAKAEPYEERKKAREKELAGLKEALDILGSETSLVQRRVHHRTLRGGMPLQP